MPAPKILNQSYDPAVPITKLKPHPRNPNRGNVGVIAESIEKHGFYGAVVAQKSTGHILAGEHRTKGMKSLKGRTVPVVWVDVTDEEALRILLVDNRSATMADTDMDMLADILSSLPDIQGTGYDQQTADMILDAVKNQTPIDLQRPHLVSQFDALPLGEEAESDPNDLTETHLSLADDAQDFDKADDEITGAFALKSDMVFEGKGYWQIPIFRPEMLMQFDEIPDNLLAWAGSATRDWPDEDQWWLYNYGIDSTSGMKDVSKVILSFYCWDDYFENWWHYPDRFVSKALNSKIKYAITPNYSQWSDQPRAVNIYALYRARWLGRYFQEAGIKIIPDITWRDKDNDYLEKYVLPGLPKNMSVIAMEAQYGSYEIKDKEVTKESLATFIEACRLVIDTLKPENLLLYCSPGGRRCFETMGLNVNIKYVEYRLAKLSEQAKQRKKKTGL